MLYMKTKVSNIKTPSFLRGNATTFAKLATHEYLRPMRGNATTAAKPTTQEYTGLNILNFGTTTTTATTND